jgi:enterochelin esterase-like enzyme
MTREELSIWSEALGDHLEVRVHAIGTAPTHAVYAWHGRGSSARDWDAVVPPIARLVAAGDLPGLVLVAPEAPWSDGGSWYVDSQYTGTPAGRPVETALTGDLVGAIEETHRVTASTAHRVVAGFSMGGAGAFRHALALPDVFGAAVALSPPLWHPLPPPDSSARAHGAFGRGTEVFVEEIYSARFGRLLEADAARPPGPRVVLAVGHDDELADVVAAAHDRCVAADVDSSLTLWPGGHDWSVWEPAFVQGLCRVLRPAELVTTEEVGR